MSTKRMGGLGKLSDFGRSTPTAPPTPTTAPIPPAEEAEPPKPEIEAVSLPPTPTPAPTPAPRKQKAPKKTEKPVTINIKIAREQQDWLADTARHVRDNNTEPVAAGDRCYPQHLIQAAIDLLASSPVNWSEIRNVEDLRKQLNL